MQCSNCNNPEVLSFRCGYDDDHNWFEYCNHCGPVAQPPPVRDYTEKAFISGVAPGKFRERLIERHRADVHANLRSMPRTVKKVDV